MDGAIGTARSTAAAAGSMETGSTPGGATRIGLTRGVRVSGVAARAAASMPRAASAVSVPGSDLRATAGRKALRLSFRECDDNVTPDACANYNYVIPLTPTARYEYALRAPDSLDLFRRQVTAGQLVGLEEIFGNNHLVSADIAANGRLTSLLVEGDETAPPAWEG